MKKGITIILIVFTFTALAQQNSIIIDSITLPDSTEAGLLIGEIASKTIGPEGGSIASVDGKIELFFPAGALSSATEISVQPMINNLPGAIGYAYRFEPSGIQFAKPVTYILHYTDEEAEVCTPDLMAFGLQDHSGKWEYAQYEGWDSVAKTLTGFIKHFSGFASYSQMRLIPTSYELRVEDTLTIHIVKITPDHNRKYDPHDAYIDLSKKTAIWMVNGRQNGSLADGFTVPLEDVYGAVYADYIAPRRLPDKNILIQVIIVAGNKKAPKVERTFTCKIKLYDEYKILIRDTIESRVGEGTFVADSGTFVAKITVDNISITDVRNYPPYSFVKHKSPLGRITVIVAGYTGPVHIGKTKHNGQLLSYSQSGRFIERYGPYKVLITFDTYETQAFRYIYSLAGVRIMEDMPLESVPRLVSFFVNGEPQKYPIDSRAGSPYTIYVERTGKPSNHYPKNF